MANKSQLPQGRNGSIFTKRKIRQGAKRDGGGKQPKRRGVYATVACAIHGVQPQAALTLREVRCAVPATRRDKYITGCPKCMSERL